MLRLSGLTVQRFNDLTKREAGTVLRLFADAMFEFPDAQGGEEERFGAGQGAGSGHGVFPVVVLAVGASARATRFFTGLRFAGGLGAVTGNKSMAAIHNYCINCNYQHI